MKLANLIFRPRNFACFLQACFCLLSIHFVSLSAEAQSPASTSRFSLDDHRDSTRSEKFPQRYTVSLNVVDDLKAPFYTIKQLRLIEASANRYLHEVGNEMSRIFRYRLQRPITLQILSPAQYAEHLGGPDWTNAMYSAGVISIPLRGYSRRALHSLQRSVRHEYVHAVVLEKSGGRAPAWVDEGLAQLLEGRENSSVEPALLNAVRLRNVPALSGLNEGFLALRPEAVRPAYGVSLFAIRTLVRQKGFTGIVSYLSLLAEGATHQDAFTEVFKLSPEEFEEQLSVQLTRWEYSKTTAR